MNAHSAASPFPATRWVLVLTLRNGNDPECVRAALSALCRDYWDPLCFLARQQGCTQEDAKDYTQAFFAYALERDLFAAADPQLGRLRSFLHTTFQRFLKDEKSREQAIKRGGSIEWISFDEAASLFPVQETDGAHPPPMAFERRWAHASLRAAFVRLQAAEKAAGREAQFEHLQVFLQIERSAESRYAPTAVKMNAREEAVRQMVSRLRRSFRRHLRQQIADTLREPSEENVAEELAALQDALR